MSEAAAPKAAVIVIYIKSPGSRLTVGAALVVSKETKALKSNCQELVSQIVQGLLQLLGLSRVEMSHLAVYRVAIDALHEPRLTLAEVGGGNLCPVDELGRVTHLLANDLSTQVGDVIVHRGQHPVMILHKFSVKRLTLLWGHGVL